ncbi:MAG TPA: YchJ family protein [Gammaproteobacteria bacterium]|nr:YchJ family protein [Gammaproteobacteria bacterium]
MDCPCRSGRHFDRCCGRFISHEATPENAQQLMRSRYSAYVLGEAGYLHDSWHPEYRPADCSVDPGIRWLGLDIIASSADGDRAQVEFEARLLIDGRVDTIHEISDFLRLEDRWFYTRGEQLAARFASWKPARNEPCPCGSGNKFKRCCAAGR